MQKNNAVTEQYHLAFLELIPIIFKIYSINLFIEKKQYKTFNVTKILTTQQNTYLLEHQISRYFNRCPNFNLSPNFFRNLFDKWDKLREIEQVVELLVQVDKDGRATGLRLCIFCPNRVLSLEVHIQVSLKKALIHNYLMVTL